MRGAGLFQVLQPRRWGGYEMDLPTFYEVQLALAQGDMSSAWIYGVCGVHPWFMALLAEPAAEEVWARDNSTLICSSLMPAGKAVAQAGGHRISGRWKYASGCAHCDWALLGAMVSTDAGAAPEGRIFLVPRTQYESVDTWHVLRLQTTGSLDIAVGAVMTPPIEERKSTLLRTFESLHAYAQRGETPPLAERVAMKFQSSEVTERCTLLAARIFKATGAAGLSDELPFGGILADLMAGRAPISTQYECVGTSFGGTLFGLPGKDMML